MEAGLGPSPVLLRALPAAAEADARGRVSWFAPTVLTLAPGLAFPVDLLRGALWVLRIRIGQLVLCSLHEIRFMMPLVELVR